MRHVRPVSSGVVESCGEVSLPGRVVVLPPLYKGLSLVSDLEVCLLGLVSVLDIGPNVCFL